jgi:hypothetical protein
VVLRYIERNLLRADLLERAEAWEWSSLRWVASPERAPVRLEPGTVPRGSDGLERVNPAVTGSSSPPASHPLQPVFVSPSRNTAPAAIHARQKVRLQDEVH